MNLPRRTVKLKVLRTLLYAGQKWIEVEGSKGPRIFKLGKNNRISMYQVNKVSAERIMKHGVEVYEYRRPEPGDGEMGGQADEPSSTPGDDDSGGADVVGS